MTNKIQRQIMEPTNLQEAMKFAETISKSGMVPDNFQGKPANVLVAVQWGYEIGLAPMQALQNIAVINGRPSLWGDSLLALIKAHPSYAGMREWMEGDTAYCEIKRTLANGEVETTTKSFSTQEAQKAGLTNKRGPWTQYPNRMLALRARGFAVRDAFPDAIKGMITAEEAMDYPPEKNAQKEGVEQAPTVSTVQTTEQLTKAIQGASKAQEQASPTEDSQEQAHADAVIDNIADHAEPGEDETETPDLPGGIPLNIPNGDDDMKVEWFNHEEDWAGRYHELMLAMYRSDHKDLTPDIKRTKMKQLKEINADVLEGMERKDLAKELEEKRLKWNSSLSLMLREQKDGK